ncbi:MAG: nucleotidyltransferase domain-containing protein, partial [Tepidisphaeraceae bacterium]
MDSHGISPLRAIGLAMRYGIMFGMLSDRIPVSADQLAAFCRKWKVRELSIFGSVLRDDFREDSDVDVLIETLPESELGWDWLDMQSELAALLGRKIDLVFKDGLRNPYRRREIL